MTERNAEVGTNGGLSQRWREEHTTCDIIDRTVQRTLDRCADDVDAAKLRIEEAVMALPDWDRLVYRTAVLKIIREIL